MPLAAAVFERRRRRFMASMGERCAAIVAAAPETVRSNDVEHRYRQNSDLYYLTGFLEPGSVCLLLPGHPTEEFVLFVQPRDRERETWTGKRTGVDGAIERFGASMAYPIDKLDEIAPKYLRDRDRWYYSLRSSSSFNQRVLGWLERAQAERPRAGTGPTALEDAGTILHDMRLFKESEELECMRRAIAISVEAHRVAMQREWAGRPEYELEALLEHAFRAAGATGPAYPSIVASGANATVLHYVSNECSMDPTDLLLVDAGAEFEGYAADITRCFPIGVSFGPEQRAVYEVVLRAQRAAIEKIRPGVAIDDVHERAVEVLIDGLLDLSLLNGSPAEVREKELYKPFYMHRTSHWLGLDVHDVGDYRRDGSSRSLEAGMVLTVEPGIYIAEHIEDVGERWHGIGVRIEDDVLVTDHGYEVLSENLPTDVVEIEALRRSAPSSPSG